MSDTTEREIAQSAQGQSTSHSTGPTRVPTWRPIASKSTITPPPPPTAEEQAQIDELRAYVQAELVLPSNDAYYEREKIFLDEPSTYPRYMRASKLDLQEAKRRIRETLEWRRSYRPDLIPPGEIAKEAETGKIIVNGFDVHGRPIVWLRPSRENTSPSPAQIRHLVFQLERALDLLPPGATTLALVVDYHGATRGSTPPLDICKSVIHILQNHYCERLGRAAVVNVPTLLQGFFAVVKPLLDPNTREKIAFNPPMQDVVPKQQLDPEFGGELEYEFDKDVYLPALCRICGVKEDGSRTEGSGEEAIPSAQATSAEGREEQSIPASTSNAPEPSAASDQTPQAVPPQATGDTNAVPAASLGGAAVAGASGAALASTSTSATPRAANGGESSAPPGKPRKGANLFSSKRGLDKAGNATIHRHKHLIKAFCMHKGAVEPGSAINADEEKAVPAGIVNEESKAQNGQETLVDDRAAILARRDERRVDEAPETEIVHSERPHPTQVHSMSQSDDAQLVSRPQVLQERLHSGGSDDLTLAFKVKQAPEGEMLD